MHLMLAVNISVDISSNVSLSFIGFNVNDRIENIVPFLE